MYRDLQLFSKFCYFSLSMETPNIFDFCTGSYNKMYIEQYFEFIVKLNLENNGLSKFDGIL